MRPQSCDATKKLRRLQENIAKENNEWETKARADDEARAKKRESLADQATIRDSKPKAVKARKKEEEKRAKAEKRAEMKKQKELAKKAKAEEKKQAKHDKAEELKKKKRLRKQSVRKTKKNSLQENGRTRRATTTTRTGKRRCLGRSG